MINYRQLIRPSPSDANLRTQSDGLFLREGSQDRTRFLYLHKGKDISLPYKIEALVDRYSNRTNDIFNHTRMTGGSNNSSVTIDKNNFLTARSSGGILPLEPLPSNQYSGNQVSSHPVPIISALVDYKISPKVSKIVDAPLPASLNPLVA
jgi:hypothetical protein